MSLKNTKDLPEMFVQTSDGIKIKIGKIQSAEIFNDDFYPDFSTDSMILSPRNTATFEVYWNATPDLVYLLIHGRFASNNWRRMHGLPLRRKK